MGIIEIVIGILLGAAIILVAFGCADYLKDNDMQS